MQNKIWRASFRVQTKPEQRNTQKFRSLQKYHINLKKQNIY